MLHASLNRGHAFTLVAFTLAGFMAIPYQIAANRVSAGTLVFGLFLLSLVMNTLSMGFKVQSLRVPRHAWVFLVLIAASSIGGNITIAIALQQISPTIAVTLQRSEILFAMGLSWLWFQDRIHWTFGIGVVMALVGMTVIQGGQWNISWAEWLPLIFGLSSGLCFALMQLFTKRIANDVDPRVINMGRLIAGTLLLGLIPAHRDELFEQSWEVWGLIALCAFLGPFVGRNLYNLALKYIPISHGVLVSTVAPVATLLAEIVVLNHWLSLREAVGCALVLFGIGLPVLGRVLRGTRKGAGRIARQKTESS